MTKKEEPFSTNDICSLGKSIQGLSDAAQMHVVKGHKVYLLSILLFWFKLIKPTILLSRLLPGFLAKILCHLSPTSAPVQKTWPAGFDIMNHCESVGVMGSNPG